MTKTVTKTVAKSDDTMSNTVSTAAYRAARREESHSAVGYMRDPLLLRQYRGLLNDRGNAQLSRALAWVTAGGIVEGLVYLAIIPTVAALASSAPAWGLGLGGWLTVLGVCAVVGGVCTYAMNLGAYRAALEGLRVMLVKVGDRLASLPLGWFDAGLNGRMSRLVTEGLMSIGTGIAHVAVPVLRNTIAALVLMVGVLIWQPMLGATLAASLLVIAALTVLSNRLEHYSHSLTDPLERELSSRIVEYASCQGALRSAGRSGNYEPLYSAIERSHGRRVRALWISTLALVLGGMSTQIVAVSLIYVSVQMALTGSLDPVSTVVFIGVMLRFTRAIQDAVSFLVGAESSRIPLADVHEILSSEPLPVPEEPAHLSDPGSVSVENVSFSYTPGVPVLRSLSFTAEPGSLTAIVGPSGSGKTTVFKLLARFWDVDSGTVRVGGVDVREQRTEQLMAQLSMVFQTCIFLTEPSWRTFAWAVRAPLTSRCFGQRPWRVPMRLRRACRRGDRPVWVRAEAVFPAVNASGFPLLVPCSRMRLSCSLMRRRAPWTPRTRPRCSSPFAACGSVQPCWLLRTSWTRCVTPIRLWCLMSMAPWRRLVPTRSSWRCRACTAPSGRRV